MDSSMFNPGTQTQENIGLPLQVIQPNTFTLQESAARIPSRTPTAKKHLKIQWDVLSPQMFRLWAGVVPEFYENFIQPKAFKPGFYHYMALLRLM
jgi:hypothetical protein